MELERCPYCGETARLVSIQNGFAIVCNDKNCLGQMQIHFGSCNNEEIFHATGGFQKEAEARRMENWRADFLP